MSTSHDYDPYEAAVLPRMLPMRDDSTTEIETRIPERVLKSYQQAWCDARSGLLNAGTDPRRAGRAGGY